MSVLHSLSALFSDPPLVAFDVIDAYAVPITRTIALCTFQPRTTTASASVPTLVLGPGGPGDVDLASSGITCPPGSTVPTVDRSRPSRARECYVLEYRAVNSRNM